MKICAIIPSHNHHNVIASIVQRLRASGLPVFIIDDGSAEPARTALAALHNPAQEIIVHRLPSNRGKGIAVTEGFRLAIDAGYTHTLQVDADGQHDLGALPQMLALSESHPDALISGQPIYDKSVPKAREIGRWVTHVWVWVETLSFRITDSMCGFRIYPLAAVYELLAQGPLGRHMEFDTDSMVRLFWQGVPPIMVPVKVIYPPGNISNFDLWRDNVRISLMHTRLVCEMLLHLPCILRHRPPPIATTHWSRLAERGAYWGLRLTAVVCLLLGKQGCLVLMSPVAIYFYLTGAKQRRAMRAFLTHALNRPVGFFENYRPFGNFFARSLDTFLAWTGKIPAEAIVSDGQAATDAFLNDPRGGLIIVAHLGNTNIAHALLPPAQRQRMTILAHTRHAENFNRILKNFCPEAAMNIFQVTDFNPATVIELKQRIEAGGRIVIAGDRTSVLTEDHTASVPFFGEMAPFPHGPWILGALLECPVHLLFCLKDGHHYRLNLEPFAERIELPRETRKKALQTLCTRYAARLEHYAAAAPFQWYNFYDFWDDPQ